jgi:hypothetical protein
VQWWRAEEVLMTDTTDAAQRHGDFTLIARSRVAAGSDGTWWISVAALVALVYLTTSHWSSGQVDDTRAAMWTAWNVAQHGSFHLDNQPPGLPDLVWFHQLGDHVVTNRSMGAILAGLPIALLLSWTGLSPEHLNALNAAVMTGATVATISLVLRRLVSDRLAIAATVTVGFGTSLWTVAASETWPQTADALYLSLALLALSRGRYGWAGVALAPAIMTRPHLALVALVLGIGLTISERRVRPLLAIGVPTSLGMGALVCWNHWMFGAWSVGGAYTGHEQRITTVPDSFSVLIAWAQNAAGAFVSPGCGLFLFAPIAGLAVWWILAARQSAPAWAWWAFLGGAAYQAVQLYLNAFHGGGGFFGNRLVIEFVVLATPLAVATYAAWSQQSAARRLLTGALAAYGVALHATGASLSWYLIGTGPGGDWTRFYPAVVVQHAGVVGWVIATTSLASAVVYVMYRVQVERARAVQTGGVPKLPSTHLGERPVHVLKATV